MKTKKKIIKSIKNALGLVRKPPERQNFTEETKKAVLRFQRYKCAVNRCGFHKNSWRYLEFDHIRGRHDYSLGNCQALCPFHHRQKTKRDRIKSQIEKSLTKNKEKSINKSVRKPINQTKIVSKRKIQRTKNIF